MLSKAKNAKLAKLKMPHSPSLSKATKKEIMKKKGLPMEKAIDTTAPPKTIVISRTKPKSGKRKSSKTLSPKLHNITKRKLALLKRKREEAKKASPRRVLFKEVVSPAKTTEKVGGNPSRDKEGSSISKKQKKIPANDAVAAKGIVDTAPAISKSTKITEEAYSRTDNCHSAIRQCSC